MMISICWDSTEIRKQKKWQIWKQNQLRRREGSTRTLHHRIVSKKSFNKSIIFVFLLNCNIDFSSSLSINILSIVELCWHYSSFLTCYCVKDIFSLVWYTSSYLNMLFSLLSFSLEILIFRIEMHWIQIVIIV